MPSINHDFLKSLNDDYSKYPNFVETGTFEGETVSNMLPYFDNLYTIEISESYYNHSRSRYQDTKINFILGDGYKVFSSLLGELSGPTIFFLDGHHSGEGTGKGEKDCPLYEEFEMINLRFSEECIIVVDDYRLFGKDSSSNLLGEDWSDITKEGLLKIVDSRISQVYHLPSSLSPDDRLVIHLKSVV